MVIRNNKIGTFYQQNCKCHLKIDDTLAARNWHPLGCVPLFLCPKIFFIFAFQKLKLGSTERLAGKFLAKAGKTSSYSEHYSCPATLLRFWMKVAIQSSATATMRGARRCGVLANWRKRWARCSRLGIAGMCLMRKRGCIICGAGIITRNGAGL